LIRVFKITGFVIGTDMYGNLIKRDVRQEAEKITDLPDDSNPADFEVHGVSEIKMISVSLYDGKKKIGDLEWAGDIDSCLADRMVSMISPY